MESSNWHHIESQRCFTTSTAWKITWSQDFQVRQQQYAVRREKYKKDAALRTRSQLQAASRWQSIRANESAEQRIQRLERANFRTRLIRYVEKGEPLAWKTHFVEYTDDKTMHRCGTCERIRNARFWWRRCQDGAFECLGCFTRDRSSAVPLGYEHWLASMTPNHEKAQSTVSKTISTKQDSGSITTH